MEKIASHIKQAELKRDSIRMSIDEASEKTSSISSLTQEWKGVEDQLELAKFSLLKHGQELDLKAKKLDEATRVLEQRNQQVGIEAEEVEERLHDLQAEGKHIFVLKKLSQEFSLEFTSIERQLNRIARIKREELQMLKGCNNEIALENQELGSMEKSIEEKNELLKSEEAKLNSAKMNLKECCNELESVQKSLQAFCNELLEKEGVENLKISAKDLDIEIELKQKELYVVKNSISDCNCELEVKQKQLEKLQHLTKECSAELDSKSRKLYATITETNNCSEVLRKKMEHLDSVTKETGCKEREFNDIRESIRQQKEELELVKKERSEQLKAMMEQQLSVENSIIVYCEELESKKRNLGLVKQSLKECSEELESKQKNLNLVKIPLRECCEELDLKQLSLDLVKISLKECCAELDSEKKNLESVKQSLIKCSKELESRKKELETVKVSWKECSSDLNSKEAEFILMQTKISEFRKELKEGEKHFDSLKKALEESTSKLEMKEKHFEARLKEFHSKEHQFDASNQHPQALEPRRNTLPPNMTDNSATAISQSSSSINEKLSPLILLDGTIPDLMPNEVLEALKGSLDPAKLVLDVMQESISQCCENADEIAKNKVLLMEKLNEVSSITISPVLKAEAAKLALSWKVKLSSRTEKSLEVWAFLLFVSVYKLVRYFGAEEILNLVLIYADLRNAPDLCQVLGFTEKIPEFIEILMERKQHMFAARFSCAFGLLNMFPLHNILQSCMDYTKEKAIDEELDALKADQTVLFDTSSYPRRSTESIPSTTQRKFRGRIANWRQQ